MRIKIKPAFTLLELIFVIVALGIIASVAISRLERDHLNDAANQILQDIRYTQHLALMDDKTQPGNNLWQRRLWSISFASCNSGNTWYYGIGSDDDNNSANNAFDIGEAATDPSSGLPMFGTTVLCENDGDSTVSKRSYITAKYGVTNVNFASDCNIAIGMSGTSGAARYIGFDFMGRPHRGYAASDIPDYSSVMHVDCTIEFTMSDSQTFQITIEDQTGRAFIVGQDS